MTRAPRDDLVEARAGVPALGEQLGRDVDEGAAGGGGVLLAAGGAVHLAQRTLGDALGHLGGHPSSIKARSGRGDRPWEVPVAYREYVGVLSSTYQRYVREEQTMTWDAFHHRGDVLRTSSTRPTGVATGSSPWSCPESPRPSATTLALVTALQHALEHPPGRPHRAGPVRPARRPRDRGRRRLARRGRRARRRAPDPRRPARATLQPRGWPTHSRRRIARTPS